MQSAGINFNLDKVIEIGRTIENLVNEKETLDLDQELIKPMKRFRSDPIVKQYLTFSNNLNYSTKYFLNQFDRNSSDSFLPSENDILSCKHKTEGTVETRFRLKKFNFRLVDVGGQRSERKKWIRCFDDVTAVIFCIALSEYDQVMSEDASINRMHDSLALFESICKEKWFLYIPIILFLNKTDLFKEKLKRTPLTVCFQEYTGPNEFEPAVEYIRNKIISKTKRIENDIFVHVTCATDTQNIKLVFGAVINLIVKANLTNMGL
jgi:GTPase SAR1 family protein